MSESHKHLKITESEWDAFCKDFDDTMRNSMCLRRSIRNCLPSWRARKATSSAHRRGCDDRTARPRRRGDRV